MASSGATFSCPSCGRRYPWKPALAGRRARCKCGAAVAVPSAPPDADDDAPIPLSDEVPAAPADAGADPFAQADELFSPAAQEAAAKEEAQPAEAAVRPVPRKTLSPAQYRRPARIDQAPDVGDEVGGMRGYVSILFGALIIAGGLYEFYDLSDFERRGGRRSVHWLVAALYHAGGKWAVAIGLVLVGALVILGGAASIRRGRRR